MASTTPQELQRLIDAMIQAVEAIALDHQPGVTLVVNGTHIDATGHTDLIIRVSPCPRVP